MSEDDRPREALGPADERLQELLALLQTDAGRLDPVLVERVMRAVRWQRTVRDVIDALSGLASAVRDSLTVLVGSQRSSRRADG